MAVPPSPERAERAPVPGPTTPDTSRSEQAAPRGELGAKLERLAREQRPPTFQGRGWVVALVFALALGGLVVKWLQGGTASPLAQAVRDTHGKQPPAPPETRNLPRGPGIVAAPGPEPAAPDAPKTVQAPAPAAPVPPSQGSVVAPSAAGLALAALRAPPKERPALRQVALHAFGELARQPDHRRAALEAALRLSPEAVPEEAEQWQSLTQAALAALEGPDAGLVVLYLGSLFDRGGEPGLAALERVVDEERRGLELRVAAARALPHARRAPLAIRIGSRRDAHPTLLAALR